MKKIIKFYEYGFKRIHIIGLLVISLISLGLGYVIYGEHGIIGGIITTIGIFSVFIWKVQIDDNEVKRRKEFAENKYGSDPEWEKYKELKKKFNNS